MVQHAVIKKGKGTFRICVCFTVFVDLGMKGIRLRTAMLRDALASYVASIGDRPEVVFLLSDVKDYKVETCISAV